ncbi:hypothetical protein GIB67_013693, partial [Kingdonia uniflora]
IIINSILFYHVQIFVTASPLSVLCILVAYHVYEEKTSSWIIIYLRLLAANQPMIFYGLCKSFLNSFLNFLDHGRT